MRCFSQTNNTGIHAQSLHFNHNGVGKQKREKCAKIYQTVLVSQFKEQHRFAQTFPTEWASKNQYNKVTSLKVRKIVITVTICLEVTD